MDFNYKPIKWVLNITVIVLLIFVITLNITENNVGNTQNVDIINKPIQPDVTPERVEKHSFPEIVWQSVEAILQDIEKGNLYDLTVTIKLTSGRMIMDKDGKEFSKGDLSLQTPRITPYGREAVPVLLKWLPHKRKSIRYVCAVSLYEITGIDEDFPWNIEPGTPNENDEYWLPRALNRWNCWYQGKIIAQHDVMLGQTLVLIAKKYYGNKSNLGKSAIFQVNYPSDDFRKPYGPLIIPALDYMPIQNSAELARQVELDK